MQKIAAQLYGNSQRINESGERMLRLYQLALHRIPRDKTAAIALALSSEFRALASASDALLAREKQISAYSPEKNLRLGYSLVFVDGKIVRSALQLQPGDLVNARLHDGEFTSKVETVE